MRCCNCRYCYVDSWDESDWTCGIFGSDAEDMITEDKNGDYGCRYNSRFLKKKERELALVNAESKEENTTEIKEENV